MPRRHEYIGLAKLTFTILCYSGRFSFASLRWFHSFFHETKKVIVFFCWSFTQKKTEDADGAFLRVFSRKRSANQRKKCRNDILQLKTSLYAKIRQFLSNFFFGPKSSLTPFFHRGLQLLDEVFVKPRIIKVSVSLINQLHSPSLWLFQVSQKEPYSETRWSVPVISRLMNLLMEISSFVSIIHSWNE